MKNVFYFNSNKEQIEDYQMASFDKIITNKSKEEFMQAYINCRFEGYSIEDSIDWAK